MAKVFFSYSKGQELNGSCPSLMSAITLFDTSLQILLGTGF